MTANRLALAAAAVAAGTFLCTGCEPVNGAGSPGGSGGTTCDPNGWGPLSGCDGADTATSPDQEYEIPAVDRKPQDITEPSETTETSEPSRTTEPSQTNFTVTVTWIVVSIDITGFRECVLDLREAPPNSDDHFSRRITTPQDCEAQQVDAVYKPVSE